MTMSSTRTSVRAKLLSLPEPNSSGALSSKARVSVVGVKIPDAWKDRTDGGKDRYS